MPLFKWAKGRNMLCVTWSEYSHNMLTEEDNFSVKFPLQLEYYNWNTEETVWYANSFKLVHIQITRCLEKLNMLYSNWPLLVNVV